jgi:hypothetical protein
MPQKFHNIVTVRGPEDKRLSFISKCFSRNSFDFNKVIPMPEELDIPAGSQYMMGMMYIRAKAGDKLLKVFTLDDFYFNVEKESNRLKAMNLLTPLELGQQALFNYEKYGYYTWLDWCYDKWGTKWNAFECVELAPPSQDVYVFTFKTVWCPPVPVYRVLNEMFPELEFSCTGSDKEDEDPTFAMLLTGANYVRGK